jgi:hypothetical protein
MDIAEFNNLNIKDFVINLVETFKQSSTGVPLYPCIICSKTCDTAGNTEHYNNVIFI